MQNVGGSGHDVAWLRSPDAGHGGNAGTLDRMTDIMPCSHALVALQLTAVRLPLQGPTASLGMYVNSGSIYETASDSGGWLPVNLGQ